MGHASTQNMINALNTGSWIVDDITADDIKNAMKQIPCVICEMAKRNKPSAPKSITNPKEVPIGHLSGDIVGPINPMTKDGEMYFFLFVDRRTSYMHVYTSATKTNFITALKDVCKFYADNGHRVHSFRSDSEQILVEGDVEEFLSEESIQPQHSLPYMHYQNLVERHVLTVTKMLSAMVHDQVLLDGTFWNYALFLCVCILNNTPNVKTDGLTPASMVIKDNPKTDLNRRFLFPFGAPVAVRIPKRTWKFDVRSELGVYLGETAG